MDPLQTDIKTLKEAIQEEPDLALKINLFRDLISLQEKKISDLENTQRAVADANVHISELYMELEDAQDLILQQKNEILQQNEELSASIDQLKMVNEHLEELNAVNLSLRQEKKQGEKIQRAHKALVSSVNYSKRIQFNLLPKIKDIAVCYKDFFAMYIPKDIVSGDYYWFHSTPHYNILVTADCTGHGVSGAFMTLIGHNLLDKLVCQWGMYDPADLLHEMNVELRRTLKQNTDAEIRDSMEMTIFVDNKLSNKVSVASAKRPFVHFAEGKSFLIKGDKYPVGDAFYPIQSFKNHEFDRVKGDRFFFFSDGITDQFGGDENKKLTTKGFVRLLESLQPKSMQLQQFKLQQFFNLWKGNNRQLDDVMVLALEL